MQWTPVRDRWRISPRECECESHVQKRARVLGGTRGHEERNDLAAENIFREWIFNAATNGSRIQFIVPDRSIVNQRFFQALPGCPLVAQPLVSPRKEDPSEYVPTISRRLRVYTGCTVKRSIGIERRSFARLIFTVATIL